MPDPKAPKGPPLPEVRAGQYHRYTGDGYTSPPAPPSDHPILDSFKSVGDGFTKLLEKTGSLFTTALGGKKTAETMAQQGANRFVQPSLDVVTKPFDFQLKVIVGDGSENVSPPSVPPSTPQQAQRSNGPNAPKQR